MSIADGQKFYRRMENQIRLDRGLAPLGESIGFKQQPELENKTKGVVNLLNSLTNGMQLKLPEQAMENRLFRRSTKSLADQQQLPTFPDQWTETSLREYVHTLTRWNLSTNEHIRLAKLILKDLLVMNRRRVLGRGQITTVYNDAIAYFLQHRDVLAARELKQVLRQENAVDLTTYKLFLLSIRSRWQADYQWNQYPINTVINILNEMKQRGVAIDAEVWNIVLITMPNAQSRIAVLNAMQKLQVPLSRRGLNTVFNNVVEILGLEYSMSFLAVQNQFSVTIECLNKVVYLLMAQGTTQSRKRAWTWLKLALGKWNHVKPTTATLNTILEAMVESQRLDWMFGVLGGFSEVKPDSRTFQLMFRAALGRSYHANKHQLLNLIWSRWKLEKNNDSRMEYYRNEAMLQSEFNLKMGQSTKLLELRGEKEEAPAGQWEEIINKLQWGTIPKLHYKKTESSASRNTASFVLGFPVENLHPSYKHGPFKFYKQPFVNQWRQFAKQHRQLRRNVQQKEELDRRRSIVNKGATNSFISSLVHNKVISDD